jgi:hypothetical protein
MEQRDIDLMDQAFGEGQPGLMVVSSVVNGGQFKSSVLGRGNVQNGVLFAAGAISSLREWMQEKLISGVGATPEEAAQAVDELVGVVERTSAESSSTHIDMEDSDGH